MSAGKVQTQSVAKMYVLFLLREVVHLGPAVPWVPNVLSNRHYQPASQSRRCNEGKAGQQRSPQTSDSQVKHQQVGLKVEQRTDKEAAHQPTISDHTKRPCNSDHITPGFWVEKESSVMVWARRLSYKPPAFFVCSLRNSGWRSMEFTLWILKWYKGFWLDETFTLALS